MRGESISFSVDREFHTLIPPLAPEELSQLTANIMADGIRDPLVVWNGLLLDGHNRYAIAKKHGLPYRTVSIELADRDAAKIWLINNQFGRRNIAPFTRVELALKLEPLLAKKAKENQKAGGKEKVVQKSAQPESERKTRTQLAKVAGVSHDTIAKGKLVALHADEETKDKLRRNQVSVHRVAKDIKERIDREARKAERMEAAKDAPALDSRILVGDFRQVSDSIKNGSLSLIFTDPPYDREASKMLPALGEFAKAKLAKGGSLICYVGQTQLPAALDAFREHLRYWWTIACVHSGRATVMREYGVNAGWKAVLWFVKTTRDDNSVMVSDVMSGGEEKQHHDWQQAQSEAEYWIGKLCPKDGLVCDPFLGSGTTAAAAQKLKREWVGIERDADTAAIANKRLAT